MSSMIFDAGDKQRIKRDFELTKQSDRQELIEDRSPDEGVIDSTQKEADEFTNETQINPFGFMVEGFLAALKERL